MEEKEDMKKIDEFIEEELDKDVTQEETIDESVEQHIGEMGFLWDRVQQKIKEDKICFGCKKEIEVGKDVKTHLVEAKNVEKGVIAFVSICDTCFEEQAKAVAEKEAKEQEKNGE